MPNIFFLLILLFSSLSYANTVKINETLTTLNITDSIKVYRDINGTLTPKDILNAEKLGLQEEKLHPISSAYKGIYWFYVSIENTSEKQLDWTLSIPKANSDGNIYYINQKGEERGTSIAESYSFLNYPTISYLATSQPKETGALLIKTSSSGGYFIFPKFDITAKELFLKQTITNTMIKSIVLGAIMILFTYNLFLFFSFKTKAYAWYCVYIFFVALFFLSNNGIGYQFLWGSSEFLSKNIFVISYPLMFASALQFSREFLKTKKRFLLLDRLLNIFSILFVVLLIVFIMGFKVDSIKIFTVSSLVMSLLPLLGLYVWRQGYKEARFYTVAWSAWALGMTPLMLLMLGANIEFETALIGGRVGIIFESILLSFALADQINILREQKEEAVAKYEAQRALLEVNSRQAQMGEMVSAIIHQWNQPLTLLMIMLEEVQMIASEGDKKISKKVDTEITNIQSVITGMSSTMDDFRNFFSPSKNKKTFYPISTVNTILAMFGKQYEYENISFEISGDETIKIIGKENELKQVLLNLFNNAKDAFCSHDIMDRKIEISLKKDGGFVVLEIKDNAGGMPTDVIEKIFEQYYTTKGEKGTGIGLYICKKIIEESFAGTITTKGVGNGTVFTIVIPTMS